MKIFKTVLIILIMLSAGLTYSQIGKDKRGFKDGIDSVMKQKMIDRLGLDNTTADKFLSTYKDNNKQIRTIMKEKKDLMETIELDPSAADIDSKLDMMLDLESKIVDQKRSFFNDLRTFLTPQQIAKTILLRKNFEKELRKEINSKRKNDRMRDKDDKPDDKK